MLGVRAILISALLFSLGSMFQVTQALARNDTQKPTVCTISLDDSKKELEAFKRATKGTQNEGGRYYELTPTDEFIKQNPDPGWFTYSCHKATDPTLSTHVHCDTVIISGHYFGGFFGKRGLSLTREDLEKHACTDCKGLLGGARQIFVFDSRAKELEDTDSKARTNFVRVQIALGKSRNEADRLAEQKYQSFATGGEDFLKQLTGPSAMIHGVTFSPNDSASKKALENSLHDALVDDQKIMVTLAVQNVSLLNSAPDKACPSCSDKPSYPDAKTCAKYTQSATQPESDANSRAGSNTDPCQGLKPSELGMGSCPEFYELYGKPGEASSCCVLKPLGDENLKALQNPKFSDPTILRQLDTTLKYQEVRNYVSKEQVPPPIVDPKLGPVIRISEWNVDKGANFEAINKVMSDCTGHMMTDVKSKPKQKLAQWEKTYNEACKIGESDILIVDEVDDGMCRSGYRNVTRELARNNGYNYAFSPEFVEVDPKTLDPKKDWFATCDKNAPRPKNMMNLHGDSILSRYPISQMHTLRLDQKSPVNTLCYDWMRERKMGDPNHVPQKVVNFGLNMAFKVDEDTPSQQRRGSRLCQIATIQSPNGPYRIVNCHLESKTTARCRQAQMQAIDDELHREEQAEGEMPIIIAGDWNTTQKDGRPVTFDQQLKNQFHTKNLIENAVNYTTPYGMMSKIALTAVNEIRSREVDPTHACLYPIQEKQTCENGTFKVLTQDGFDDPSMTNERGRFGYAWSYAPDRDFGKAAPLVGDHMRDDFMMERGVKIENPDTLQTTRFSSELSDHVPITGLIQVLPPDTQRTNAKPANTPVAPADSKPKKPGFFKRFMKKLEDL